MNVIIYFMHLCLLVFNCHILETSLLLTALVVGARALEGQKEWTDARARRW